MIQIIMIIIVVMSMFIALLLLHGTILAKGRELFNPIRKGIDTDYRFFEVKIEKTRNMFNCYKE